MNAKAVALCSMFTAIAIILDRVRIPTLPGQVQFYFWEIPIVIALLLFGFKLGFSVAVLSALGQALIFPRALGFLFPIWSIIVMSTLIVGVNVAYRILAWRASKSSGLKSFRIAPVVCLTASAIVFRLAPSPFINFFMYKYMMPLIGAPILSDATIIGMIPWLLAFDTILVLYTVPTSHAMAKIINKNLKVGNQVF